MRVIDEGYRTFKTKGVEQKEYVVTMVDDCPPPRCTNNFGLVLEGEAKDKYLGKLIDQRVEIQVQNMQQRFDGQIRLSGSFNVLNGVVKKTA